MSADREIIDTLAASEAALREQNEVLIDLVADLALKVAEWRAFAERELRARILAERRTH